MTAQEEQWKDVPSSDGYQVSNIGRVRSVDRTITYSNGQVHHHPGKMLTASIGNHGYPVVSIPKNRKSSPRTVHSIVAEAFIGPRPKGMEVCHGDGDRTNPRLENLRYGTSSENQQDILAHGRDRNANKKQCNRGHDLSGNNLTPSILKHGRRQCLACVRARAKVAYHKNLRPQLQEIADQYFKSIMSESENKAA